MKTSQKYLAIDIPTRMVVMTVEEYMDLPREMLRNWSRIRLVVGDDALVDLLKESSG